MALVTEPCASALRMTFGGGSGGYNRRSRRADGSRPNWHSARKAFASQDHKLPDPNGYTTGEAIDTFESNELFAASGGSVQINNDNNESIPTPTMTLPPIKLLQNECIDLMNTVQELRKECGMGMRRMTQDIRHLIDPTAHLEYMKEKNRMEVLISELKDEIKKLEKHKNKMKTKRMRL